MRGEPAAVIRPNPPDVTEVPGLLKFVWFSTLKNSARYCKFQRSVIRKFLCAEKSMLNVPGPRRIFRPALPKVPSCATLKDSVVNHLEIRSACDPLVSEGFETTSA